MSNDGVTGQAFYSFLKEEWKTDASLIPYPFPMVSITPEQFEFIDGWRPSDINVTTVYQLIEAGAAPLALASVDILVGAAVKGNFVEISKTEAHILEYKELTKPIAPENAIGRISRMDAINNKSVAEASLRNRRRKLAKLRVAYEKIGEEGYGICSTCKKIINPKRLLLMPESDKCVLCAGRI